MLGTIWDICVVVVCKAQKFSEGSDGFAKLSKFKACTFAGGWPSGAFFQDMATKLDTLDETVALFFVQNQIVVLEEVEDPSQVLVMLPKILLNSHAFCICATNDRTEKGVGIMPH